MSATNKDTIYIDIDDEITAIIEKVQKSSSNIVALVLPKRATVLQSIVNMKLLKRSADELGKRVVLITSENGLLPLAGAVGMYVASNLQSKPEIPAAPDIEDADEAIEDVPIDPTQPVGELAGAKTEPEETVNVDNAPPVQSKSKKSKNQKDKSKKVPNFEKFRLKLFLIIGGVIILLLGWYWAAFVAPSAKVTIHTDTSSVNSQFTFSANPSVTAADTTTRVIPSKNAQVQKTDTQTAPATGQQDVGTKATGTVVMTASCAAPAPTIPSGTGVSADGLTFITQASVTLVSTDDDEGNCIRRGSTSVAAQNNGDQYNLGPRTYVVAGFSGVSAAGTQMSGGTSRTIKVVTQQDIDAARQKITDNSQASNTQLRQELESDNYYALTDTFATTHETITNTPNVNQEGDQVSVTAARTYEMTGIKKEDLRKLIEANVQAEIEKQQQQIQDDGIDNAVFRVVERRPDGTVVITVDSTVTLGPNIDTDAIKQDIAGKKRGDSENIIKALPGVRDAQINYSPFWVGKTPKNTSKITIEFQKAN